MVVCRRWTVKTVELLETAATTQLHCHCTAPAALTLGTPRHGRQPGVSRCTKECRRSLEEETCWSWDAHREVPTTTDVTITLQSILNE